MAGGPVVEETIVRLAANGQPLFEWRCTPSELDALVIGRLYIEGIVEDASLADRLAIVPTELAIDITLEAALETVPQKRPRGTLALPSSDEFTELFRALFAGVDARHESGGMHAAALATAAGIVFQAEDVGRHNAVDKVIGRALLAGASIASHGMVVSSRVSGEIARKAALSGVAWLASRSIPTTLAVRAAQSAALPIIGRAAGKNAFVYQ